MKDETALRLDDLLIRWHNEGKHYRHTQGFNARSAGMGSYRPSRQYDDTNGALDQHLEKIQVEAVEFEVAQLFDPHRTAIHVNARNLASEAAVWTSPRLPADPEQRKAVIAEARLLLVKRLQCAGVM